jgi:hypothetical protein
MLSSMRKRVKGEKNEREGDYQSKKKCHSVPIPLGTIASSIRGLVAIK